MKKGENIYKRSDGRWEGRYKDGFNDEGKRKYKSIYGKSYQEVKEKLNKIKAMERKPVTGKKLLMNEVYQYYMESIRFKVKQSTVSNYHNIYQNHIKPYFGNCKITKIDNNIINQFITKKLDDDCLSTKFIHDIIRLLMALLRFAVNQHWVEPIQYDLIKFKVQTKPIEIFTEKEVSLIEQQALNNLTLRNIGVLISLNMGLRIGELCALRIGDIDFEKEVIHIDKTMQRIRNPLEGVKPKTIVIVDKPKTEASVRNIPMPQFLTLILKKALVPYQKGAYFLTGRTDRFTEPRAMEKYFKNFLVSAGIINRKFHTLRHTFASRGICNHYFDIKTLSQILGHANIKTTYDNYIHSDILTYKKQMDCLNDDFINRQKLRHFPVNVTDFPVS